MATPNDKKPLYLIRLQIVRWTWGRLFRLQVLCSRWSSQRHGAHRTEPAQFENLGPIPIRHAQCPLLPRGKHGRAAALIHSTETRGKARYDSDHFTLTGAVP